MKNKSVTKANLKSIKQQNRRDSRTRPTHRPRCLRHRPILLFSCQGSLRYCIKSECPLEGSNLKKSGNYPSATLMGQTLDGWAVGVVGIAPASGSLYKELKQC